MNLQENIGCTDVTVTKFISAIMWQ